MIKVIPQPEPDTFEDLVRQPGKAHLASLAEKTHLTNKDFENKEYWSLCHDDLFRAFDGVCAYYCVKLNRLHGSHQQSTVDHYKPKSAYPELAYEWSNYRLASATANAKKSEKQDIIDPFSIENRWFRLDFMTGKVETKHIPPQYKVAAENTVRALLNDRRICDYRLEIYKQYQDDIAKLKGDVIRQEERKLLLKQESPFVYEQAILQRKL